MNLVISPGRLQGRVTAPPSKSLAHRAAICAALAGGVSVLSPIDLSQDIEATLGGIAALGAKFDCKEGVLSVTGITHPQKTARIDCCESGSTLRFLLPIAAALGADASFLGRGKLPQRPLGPLSEVLSSHGAGLSHPPGEIIHVRGGLAAGNYALRGDISSQYITGLLLALSLLEQDSFIRLLSPLESKGYVDLTLQAMRDFGVEARETAEGYNIPGGQRYLPRAHIVEGDYSNAAFWLCAGALGADLEIGGLSPGSLQGDRAILGLLERMGALVSVRGDTVRVTGGDLRGIRIDAAQIPDLIPVLAFTAAFARGETFIYNAGRLRAKESDRLAAAANGLRALGAQVEEGPDSLRITGQQSLAGGAAESEGDHRIAMALSIAALRCRGPVTVRGAHCVEKSYPQFYSHLKQLGGIYHAV